MALRICSTGTAFRISGADCVVGEVGGFTPAVLLADFTPFVPAPLSLFWVWAVSVAGCGVASGMTVGLIESYGSLSAMSVGLFMATGMTSLRFTARAARGKSLEPNSRARRARGSPWMLQSSVGAWACVAISM